MDSRTQLQELVESARKQLGAIQELIKSPAMFEAVTAEDNSLIAQASELTSLLRPGRLQKQESSTNLRILAQEFAVERIGTPPSRPITIPQAPRRTRSCPLDVLKSPILEVTERRNLKRTRSVEPASSNILEFTSLPPKFRRKLETPRIKPTRLFVDAIESEATERSNLKRAREPESSEFTDVRPAKFLKDDSFSRDKPRPLADTTRFAADLHSISTPPGKAIEFMEAPAKRTHKRTGPPKVRTEPSRVSKRLIHKANEHAASTASASPPVKVVQNPHLQWTIIRRYGSKGPIIRGEPCQHITVV